ncbi:MAG: DUF222 domain-containing protein [Nitriliruptoraceae bacterium]
MTEPATCYTAGSPRIRPRRAPHLSLASEAGAVTDARWVGDTLDREVAALASCDLEQLSNEELRAGLDALRGPIARLSAVRTRIAGELSARAITSAPPEKRGQAKRQTQEELVTGQHMTPSEAKRTTEAGRITRQREATGREFAQGRIREEHVRQIGDTLWAVHPDRQAEVEQELLAFARDRDPVSFGREARRIAAREGAEHVADRERRQHRERRVRATDTADGGFAFSGLLYGTMAEQARVAFQAFTRPDGPDERRTPEQRTADGFDQLCAAALRDDSAPTRHGARPQVLVIIDADQIDRPFGVGRFASGQPVTMSELRPLLQDCSLGWLLLGADRTPLEASELVRTVPAGLWRSLVVRDGGCTWRGCDAPATWCEVAHGPIPFRKGGRLSPENAALLCKRHHGRFDRGGWNIHIQGDQVTYTRTPRPEHPGAPPPAIDLERTTTQGDQAATEQTTSLTAVEPSRPARGSPNGRPGNRPRAPG